MIFFVKTGGICCWRDFNNRGKMNVGEGKNEKIEKKKRKEKEGKGRGGGGQEEERGLGEEGYCYLNG